MTPVNLPLVYNGDLCTPEAVQELLEEYPRLKGVMLGRGCLLILRLPYLFAKVNLPIKQHYTVRYLQCTG
mgnify:CR=1 FL=1